ncbi:hypothetical protein UFOVP274_18 [uncultured Caudovirales phage]|uniref:Uncharacterized protein n=1 Tax=uncultured Caudovirales phage TaxID=2100421 RepID=A0A6J5LKB6_9CAUD|nr:hypothetical protein UFOVP274_18 [uncultured Caudovirales phage]
MAEQLTEAQRRALQEAADAKARKQMEQAPTTKTTMGKVFAKGGPAWQNQRKVGVNMRKAKRYDEGGETLSDIPDVGTPYGRYKTAATDTFKEAFAEARANGEKTFEWNGKMYSTAMAGEKKPVAKPQMMDRSFKTASQQANADDEMSGARKGVAPKMPSTRSGSIMDKSDEERSGLVTKGLRIAEAERAMKAHKAAQKPMGYAKGGLVMPFEQGKGRAKSSASSRGDGIAQRGKTRGKYL